MIMRFENVSKCHERPPGLLAQVGRQGSPCQGTAPRPADLVKLGGNLAWAPKRRGNWRSAAAWLLMFAAVSCSKSPDSQPPATQRTQLLAFVSIDPQAYFVERVGGGHVRGRSIAAARTIGTHFRAHPQADDAGRPVDVLFLIGQTFGVQLGPQTRAAFPKLNIVDTRKVSSSAPWKHTQSTTRTSHPFRMSTTIATTRRRTRYQTQLASTPNAVKICR